MSLQKPAAAHGRIISIQVGQRPGDAKERVGYLPEERGLYRDLKALDTLVYLAELEGMARATA